MILHITTRTDWENALSAGQYTAPSLQNEGFIHCSTLKQTIDTANMFFKGQNGLVLLCIDETKLNRQLKYEDPTGSGVYDSRVDKLFPHIYGPFDLDAVVKVVDFPSNEDGSFKLPDGVKMTSYLVHKHEWIKK
jgi:uncharacterized protein (DUF952 family)